MTTEATYPLAGIYAWLIWAFAVITLLGTVMTMRHYPGHAWSWVLVISLEVMPGALAFRAKRFLSHAEDQRGLMFAFLGLLFLYMAINSLLTLMSAARS
jgi:hypothetical protein